MGKKKKINFEDKKDKDLAEIKAAYKSGKLKFNSKRVAESILKEFKPGLTRR